METNSKKAIIVGASSGIGLATALLLMEKGYEVTNISRSMPPAMVETVLADASVRGDLNAAINEAAQGGKVDVLIYSAGCSMASPIEYADPNDYRYLFEVNFFGILEAIQAVLPYMKQDNLCHSDMRFDNSDTKQSGESMDEQEDTQQNGKHTEKQNKDGGGRIVLISSLGGTLPIAFDAFYSASKAAVDMIAEAGDIELKPYNIRVCSVRPGGVKTNFTFKRNIYGAETVKEYAEKQKKAVATLAAIEQGGLDPRKVAGTVYDIISAQNPPTKVVVGLKNKAFSVAAKILPDRMVGYFNSIKYQQ